MREIFKMTGSLLLVALLIAHFFLIALFVAPTDKLLGLVMESNQGFLGAEDIPKPVEDFLLTNKVAVNGDYELIDSHKGELIFKPTPQPTPQAAPPARGRLGVP